MSRSVFATMGLLPAMCTGLIACASSQPVRAAKTDFHGVWSVKHCDKAEPSRECGAFYLYLTQQGDRICGEHFVATAGLARVDEGDPGTVLGTSDGKDAVLLIKSTRNNAWYMAKGEISGDRLTWQRIGMAVPGMDDEPPIIPQADSLTKSTAPEQLEHLKEIEAAPCQWADQKH